MKLALALLIFTSLFAQPTPPAGSVGPTLPATCFPGQLWKKTGPITPGIYICNPANTWTIVSAEIPITTAWGGINGILNNQADLQAILNDKASLASLALKAPLTSPVFSGNLDASNATTTRPIKTGTSLPGSCGTGEVFFKTNATAGSNVYTCVGDVWSVISSGEIGTVGIGLGKAGTQYFLDTTIGATYAPAVCPPVGAVPVGVIILCSNNNDTYRGTGSGVVQVNGTPSVAPGSAFQFYITNGSSVTDWGTVNSTPDITITPASSTVTFGINTTTIPKLASNNVWTGKRIVTPTATQTLLDATAITAAQLVEITSAADRTLTATPTIAAGTAGEYITILNVGTYKITLQDETQLAGSNLHLSGGANFDLLAKNAMQFVYSATAGSWIQVGGGGATLIPSSGATWAETTGTWAATTTTWATI